MAFNFDWNNVPQTVAVFVKVGGETRKYLIGSSDHNEARQEVIRHLNDGFRQHGAVLVLVK